MSKKKIKSPTWVIHNVISDEETRENAGQYFGNCHTHGLNKYGHRELCFVLALEPQLLGSLLNDIGMKIANEGAAYAEGLIPNILGSGYELKGYTIKDDPTLYLFMPDENNKFPGDEGCNPDFVMQEKYARYISENNLNPPMAE